MEIIYLLVGAAKEWKLLVDKSRTQTISRKEAGLQVKKTGPFWKHAILISMVTELPPFTGDILTEERMFQSIVSVLTCPSANQCIAYHPILRGFHQTCRIIQFRRSLGSEAVN